MRHLQIQKRKRRKPEYEDIDLPESDPNWSLEEWAAFINNLIGEHGSQATLRTDAGYNNSSFIINRRKQRKR